MFEFQDTARSKIDCILEMDPAGFTTGYILLHAANFRYQLFPKKQCYQVYPEARNSWESCLYVPVCDRVSRRVHAARHIDGVTPDIVVRFAGADYPGHHRTHVYTLKSTNKFRKYFIVLF